MDDPTPPASERELLFSIAECRIRVTAAEPGLRMRVTGAGARFLVADGEPDVELEARYADLDAPDPGAAAFDSGGVWRVFQADGGWLFRFRSPALGAAPYKEASLDADFQRGEVRLRRSIYGDGRPVNPLDYPLDELLLIQRATRAGGVEIHGCGARNAAGEGLLFVGASGAGKSTVAGLYQNEPGTCILSDDRIIIHRTPYGPRIYGTPWHGDARLGAPSHAPLRGVFFLRHGPDNRLRSLPAPRATARLLACSFPPFYSRESMDQCLDACAAICTAVPVWELEFRPDSGLPPFIARELGCK